MSKFTDETNLPEDWGHMKQIEEPKLVSDYFALNPNATSKQAISDLMKLTNGRANPDRLSELIERIKL